MAEQKTRLKKKKWVPIIAPKLFKEQPLGEISLVDTNSAVGRTITVNLMNLTGNMKRQNTEVSFKVSEIKEGKALTELVSYKIVPSSLKRLVRRGREKVEDTLICSTSDNMKVNMKLFLITRFAIKKSVLTALRKSANDIISREVKKIKFDNLFSSIVASNFQRSLMAELAKIYPLRICEIRELKLLEEKQPGKEVKPREKHPKKEEKKVEKPKEAPKEEKKPVEKKEPVEEVKEEEKPVEKKIVPTQNE